MSKSPNVGSAAFDFVDERTGIAKGLKNNLKKIFPDHWSFMLGEMALYSFIILLLSGVFLSLFFVPSQQEIIYHGAYAPLAGLKMSQAYASTIDMSFDVRGGLLMRQIHHWAALIFLASMIVHLLRIFFTGAYRKPREFNWLLGIGLLTLGIVEGFAGYSLPDDLLSGTGLRIAEAIVQAIPLIGTYAAFFLFGGAFPGNIFISRLYTIHVLLIPGIILALITVHLMMVWFQKHTQYPGPGRTEKNVVGYPLMPIYMAKAGGFFFIVFGITAFLGALFSINPIWLYGPYNPSQISAGSQPDFYMGWLDGLVRMTPNIETHALGHTISWNILVPALIVPGIFFTGLALYPFIESWVNGDKSEHHLLERPRNAPTRTALGVGGLTFMIVALLNGGNDIVATHFGLTINGIMWFARIGIFVLPVVAFIITKRVCLGLQHKDRDTVLHGRETGRLVMLPSGEFIEIHEEISVEDKWSLTQHKQYNVIPEAPSVDANALQRRIGLKERTRRGLSKWMYGEQVAKPTPKDLHELEGGHH